MKKFTYMALVAVFALAVATAGADYLDFELEYDVTDYAVTEVEGDDAETYLWIEASDAETYGPPGEPCIPRIAYDVIIPFGSTNVSVEIQDPEYMDVEDAEYLLYPGQEPKWTDGGEGWVWTEPGDVYEGTGWYPGVELDGYGKGLWRGHFASQCLLNRVQYNPDTQEYKLLESATVRVNYTAPGSPPSAERWEWEHVYDRWSDYLKTFVLNPDDVYDNREPVNFVDTIAYDEYEENEHIVKVAYNQESEFYSSFVPVPDDETWPESGPAFAYQYVIITNDKAYHESAQTEDVDLTDEVGPLRQWKTDKGVPTVVKTVDDIVARYEQEGNEYWDPQVAIRKFLIAAMEGWGPEYIAFIGDVDHLPEEYSSDWGKYGVVPIRVLARRNYPYIKYVNGEPVTVYEPEGWGDVVTSDLYYTDLDEPGDWDGDEDGVFGEPGEEHDNITAFKPDVACGWIPASTTTELEDYITKVLKYEKDPNLGEIGGVTYLSRFLHVVTDEGLGSTAEETKNFLPGFTPTYMYESPQENGGPGEFPTYPQPHDINDAIDNTGYGIIEMDTHGHPFFHYILTQGENDTRGQVWASHPGRTSGLINNTVYTDTIEDLDNDYYGIIVSPSCKTNCFEYDYHTGRDIVSECYLFDDDGGGVAYLGDTRDGSWGSSVEITQEFYQTLLRKTATPDDDNYFLGAAETWSRARYFGKKPYHYYVYQHMLCGDPELNVWTDDPEVLDMDINVTPAGGGMYDVQVTVKDKNAPASKIHLANVCLNGGEDTYLLNLSNYDGRCDFRVPADSSGNVTATKQNWVPAQEPFVAE